LSDRYLEGIPPLSRAAKMEGALRTRLADRKTLPILRSLNALAKARGQSLSRMALAWALRDPRVTSAIIGVSGMAQLEANLRSLERLDFSKDELRTIDRIVRAVPPL
jgi:L-glyceraldehyde 3-phosphate reductase